MLTGIVSLTDTKFQGRLAKFDIQSYRYRYRSSMPLATAAALKFGQSLNSAVFFILTTTPVLIVVLLY